MNKLVLSIASVLVLGSGSAFAASRQPASSSRKPLVDYTEKNRKYFAKLDRQLKAKDPAAYAQLLRDRAYNASGANSPAANMMLDVARFWSPVALTVSTTVNPVGTKLAVDMFLNANAYRLPF